MVVTADGLGLLLESLEGQKQILVELWIGSVHMMTTKLVAYLRILTLLHRFLVTQYG